METSAPSIPGKPHRWATEIKAWADGRLVQSRCIFGMNAPSQWSDCHYASRGEPNWDNTTMEFRIATLTPRQQRQVDTARLVTMLADLLADNLGAEVMRPHVIDMMHRNAAEFLDALEMASP